jgi:hypothetical protein
MTAGETEACSIGALPFRFPPSGLRRGPTRPNAGGAAVFSGSGRCRDKRQRRGGGRMLLGTGCLVGAGR